jgi:ATP-binding cassette subfamily B protein
LVRLMFETSPLQASVYLAVTILVLGLDLAWTLLTGLVVGLVPGAVHDGVAGPGGQRLLEGLGLFAVAYLGSNVLGSAQQLLMTSLTLRINGNVRDRLVEALLAHPTIEALEDSKTLDRVALANAGPDGTTLGLTAVNVVSTVSRYLVLVAYGAVLWTFSPLLAVAMILIVWVARISIGIIYRPWGRAFLASMGQFRRSDYVAELGYGPSAAKEARVFGLGRWLVDRFHAERRPGIEAVFDALRRVQIPNFVWGLVYSLCYMLGYAVIVTAALDGRISVGRMVIYVMACGQLMSSTYIGDRPALESARAAFSVLDGLETATKLSPSGTAALRSVAAPLREIRLSELRFTYPGQERPVFDGLNLALTAGQSCAVVGMNGAGKTTLIKLLAGLYKPQAGTISVDGQDLATVDMDEWRARLAVIFQDFVPYALSARDNVGFGNVDLRERDELLELAAERAGASEIITSLSAGWETILSRSYQGGTDLSGGQWQRIALARALMAVEGGAGVLVLDEPTANLDVRAEAELFDRFLELTSGLTTILVSHRFSTVRRAARIIVLNGGRVSEDGTHDQLLAAGGKYARLFTMQASRFGDPGPTAHEKGQRAPA